MLNTDLKTVLAQLCYWKEFKDDEKALNRLVGLSFIEEEDVDYILEKKKKIEFNEDKANDDYDRDRCGDIKLPTFGGF